MHTVELLEEALAAAQRLGYKLRQEWFGIGTSGCEIQGQKWIFLDLAQSPVDQLHGVIEALRQESSELPPRLRRLAA